MGRSAKTRWRGRIAAALLLLVIIAGAWAWWVALDWRPSREEFPLQGVLLGAEDGPLDANALRSLGAEFVYLEASHGGAGRDARFAASLEALQGGTLPHGVVHAYDPCIPADRQAANFVTIVPRDAGQLPPAIALDKLASSCGDAVTEASLESELTTFINQVENHMGQPVVLKIEPEFEAQYGIGARVERNLWLSRDFLQPDYAGRPWALWTANSHLRDGLTGTSLRWVVVQP